nr:uncharacterized protein LOC111513263 [Leptinotarsa decemlineata]XP_023025213.1 uncharacterized protein LOC111513263 [Leptinotarsa decemlineata]
MHSSTQSNYREKVICRACLQIIHGPSFKVHEVCNPKDEEEIKIHEILKIVVPELFLKLSESPEICYDCKESVRMIHAFRRRCIQTVQLIALYIKYNKNISGPIDLHSVLEYHNNKQLVVHQNVQKIISDWEDDSSGDKSSETMDIPITEVEKKNQSPPSLEVKRCFVPSCPNTSINSNKQFIRLPKQDKIRRNWCSAVGTNISFSKTSRLYCCDNHFNIEEDSENWMKFKIMNAKLRMKNDVKPHLNLNKGNTEVCEKIQSQLTSSSRKRKVESIQFDSKNASNSNAENPSIISANRNPETTDILSSQKSPRIDFGFKTISNQVISDNIKHPRKSSRIVLFKNNNEELCIIGEQQWNEKCDQEKHNGVETESRVLESYKQTNPQQHSDNEPINFPNASPLIICEETGLFKNKEGKYFNAALEPINENDVCAEKSKAKIRGENLFKIKETFSVPDNFICEETGLFKNAKGEYFNEFGKPLNKQEVEAEKEKAKIRGENLFQITGICTIPEVVEGTAKEAPDKTITSSETSTIQPSPLENLQKLKTYCNSSKDNDKNLNEPHEGVIHIKQEPLETIHEIQQIESNNFPEDDEETLTASESASYGSLEGLLDSVDSFETNQYVDVPEFVHINKFTFKDLQKLKLKYNLHSESRSAFTNLQSTRSSLPNESQSLEKDINLKTLLAKRIDMNFPLVLNQKLPGNVAGELLKESEGGFALKKTSDQSSNVQVPGCPETSEVRELQYSSTGNSNFNYQCSISHDQKKSAPKTRRHRKWKIVAVNENETNNNGKHDDVLTDNPNRRVCVLFTNYSLDGLYINDHDYLLTPYKRNKILITENGQSFCMCFICGYKHSIDEHVVHMNLHNPKCDVCNKNFGTGYMLNLHMKNHTKPCKFCTDLVPYSEILSHEKKHKDEDLEFEKGMERKRKKKDDKDEKPVYFNVPHKRNRASKSPRLRSRSLNEADSVEVTRADDEIIVDIEKSDPKGIDIDNVETKNIETTNIGKGNVHERTAEKSNVEQNNVESNNVEPTLAKTPNINSIKGKKKHVVNEKESTESNISSPIKKKRTPKSGALSKKEVDLEEKLLKICEKSKECSERRVLRSSFLKKSSEMEGSPTD